MQTWNIFIREIKQNVAITQKNERQQSWFGFIAKVFYIKSQTSTISQLKLFSIFNVKFIFSYFGQGRVLLQRTKINVKRKKLHSSTCKDWLYKNVYHYWIEIYRLRTKFTYNKIIEILLSNNKWHQTYTNSVGLALIFPSGQTG